MRTRLNIELNFPPKLQGARSRLYRRRFLQVRTRWKALAEIYTMHSFAPFFNLKISAKNRQHFFTIEYLNFRFVFSISSSNLAFFLQIFDEFFSGFRAKFQERVTSVAFESILRKQIRKLPKILKFVKIIIIIQYYIILFNIIQTDPNSI